MMVINLLKRFRNMLAELPTSTCEIAVDGQKGSLKTNERNRI
jgi:hypothetical protein